MSKEKVKNLLSAQMTVIKKMEQDKIIVHPIFAYISYKAAVFYVTGGETYRKDDYFRYPLKEWNEENIKKGCKQLLENCAGLIPDNPINNLSASDIRNMFELFHFTKTASEAICENIYKMDFVHKMDKGRFSIYYDLSNTEENSQYEYLSIYVEENIVTLSVNIKNGVIKIFADNEPIGVAAEYAFIMNTYPEYKIKKQSLRFMEIDGKRTAVDVLELTVKDETKELYFDISEFYGKGF